MFHLYDKCIDTLCHSKGSKYTNSHISNMDRVAASIRILYSIIGPVTQPKVLTYDSHILDEENYNEHGGEVPAHRSQVLQIHREFDLVGQRSRRLLFC